MRAGELVNHSTIVIAGFRVYTPLAKHRLPFDGRVCAHYVPFAGVRNHSGTARTSVCSELRKVMDYASSWSHVQGFSLLSRSPRETGGSFVCPRHEVYITVTHGRCSILLCTIGVRWRSNLLWRTVIREGLLLGIFLRSRGILDLFEKLDETKWSFFTCVSFFCLIVRNLINKSQLYFWILTFVYYFNSILLILHRNG